MTVRTLIGRLLSYPFDQEVVVGPRYAGPRDPIWGVEMGVGERGKEIVVIEK